MTRTCSHVVVLVSFTLVCISAWPALGQTPATTPLLLNSNAESDLGNDSQISVTTDRIGNWIAAWTSNENLNGNAGTDNDICLARSVDNGLTWTPTALLNANGTSDTGEDERISIATDRQGIWIGVWRSNENVGSSIGTDDDILFAVSTNNGASWSSPSALNSNAGSDAGTDYAPDIATDGAGTWIAVWVSDDTLGGTIGTDEDILFSLSTNNGVSWSAPQPLNTNAPTDTGTDRFSRIATDESGTWIVTWESEENLGGTIGTDFDAFVSRSTNGGSTWSAPVVLNQNADTDSGQDRDPAAEPDGMGNWVAVWHSDDALGGTIGSDQDILVATSTNGGVTWTLPVALNSNAASDSGGDFDVHVQSDYSGKWVAAWRSDENLGGLLGTDFDIFIAESNDTGLTWTFPQALNSNAATDAGDDFGVKPVTDAAGNWVYVWNSDENLNGTAGTDSDVFVASFITPTTPIGNYVFVTVLALVLLAGCLRLRIG